MALRLWNIVRKSDSKITHQYQAETFRDPVHPSWGDPSSYDVIEVDLTVEQSKTQGRLDARARLSQITTPDVANPTTLRIIIEDLLDSMGLR